MLVATRVNLTTYIIIRTDVGKFSFVNRTIADWNRLPAGVIGTSLVRRHVFRKRARKVYQVR
jgi:porphobilinogen deaminase